MVATLSLPAGQVGTVRGQSRWRARSEASLTDQSIEDRLKEEAADVALACQGDERAFERLYRFHVGRVRGLTRSMAGFDAADELTQDIFVRAWEKLHTFRGDARFGTWLHRLAVNVILEDRRSRARRRAVQDEDERALDEASQPAPDGTFPIDFAAAIERLPDGARQVFVLHDVEGYKHHEVSELMGIASGTSKGQLHRARMILRRYLRGEVARPSRELQR